MTSIVTAFVDIGRGNWEGIVNNKVIPHYIKRDTETYFQRFERLTKLKNDIVCYTESKYFSRIKAMNSNIKLIAIDSLWEENKNLLTTIENIQKNTSFVNMVLNPACPEYWSSKYVVINLLKSTFVNHAIDSNFITNNDVAWIDFGYCREHVYCPPDTYWTFETDDKINLYCHNYNLFNKPIFEVIKTGEVYLQGCHIIASKNKWPVLSNLIKENLNHLLSVGLIDDDQTLLLMSYRSNPEIFKLNQANPNNWFTVFEGRCK